MAKKIEVAEKLINGGEIVHSIPLDKIIVVIAYKSDVTKEVGEDTLILNVWNAFRDADNFKDSLGKVVQALCDLKGFTDVKICTVVFSRAAHLQEDIKRLRKEFAELDGDTTFNLEDWDNWQFRFFPNGQYIGPFGE